MANALALLSKAIVPQKKAAEGEYRPGPYLLSGGWLSATAGRLMNWWQAGYSLQPYGEGNAMVEACLGAYSQTIAMCPGDHWVTLPNGGRQRITTSDVARIMRRPNDYQSMSDVLLNLTRRLYAAGEGFGVAIRNNRGDISELHLMRNGYPLLAEDGSIFYQLSGNEIVEKRFDFSAPIPARDVLHVRLHTPRNPLKGESPILSTVLDQAMAGAALNQQVNFYINEAKASFVLETDQMLTKEQTRDLRVRWDEQTKGEGAGGTPILTWGLKAKQVSVAAKDGQLAELLKMTDQNIALAFRIPLQILGVGGTPFASTEALMASWKASGLGFALNHIEEAFGLLFGLKGQPDEYLEFDTDALLRSSFKEMIDALVAGTHRVMTPNEARRKIGLPDVKGGDDVRVQQQDVPLSYGANLQPPGAAPEPAPTPDEPDEEPDDVDEEKGIHEWSARDLFARADEIDRAAA